MPQKRNPDAAELVRAKTGRIIGALEALLIVMKGLPLAYQKDMQEDKEGAIDALAALTLSHRRHDRHGARHDAGRRAHEQGRGRGLRHRDRPRRLAGAHAEDAVPRGAPRHRPDRGRGRGRRRLPLHELPLADMQAIEPRITEDVFAVLSVDSSVKSRTSFGGTAPKNVRREAKRWLKALGKAAPIRLAVRARGRRDSSCCRL